MKVKLTKTIIQSRSGTLGVGKEEIENINVEKVVKTARKGKKTVQFLEGTEVDMSDASAKKYIDKKWAVPVK